DVYKRQVNDRPNQPALCGNGLDNGWVVGCNLLRSGCKYRLSNLTGPVTLRSTLRLPQNFVHVARLANDPRLRLYSSSNRLEFAEYLRSMGCTFANNKPCYVFPLAFVERREGNSLTQYLAQWPSFNRYMSDYVEHSTPDQTKLDYNLDQNSSSVSFTEQRGARMHLLVEDPKWLRQREFFNKAQLRVGHTNCDTSICSGRTDASLTSCPYQIGNHPAIYLSFCNREDHRPACCPAVTNANTLTQLAYATDVFFAGWPFGNGINAASWGVYTIPYPDFLWEDYEGPQPLMDMLQGLALTYNAMRQRFRVSGDLFGILPFRSGLGSGRVFIPPAPLTVNPSNFGEFVNVDNLGNVSSLTPQNIENRLKAFIYASWPSSINGNNFYDIDRVKFRYDLGLLPSISDFGETNLVATLSLAGLYLRDLAKTRQVIIPVFTDLLAQGGCDLGLSNNQTELTFQNLLNCLQTRTDRSGVLNANSDTYRTWIHEMMWILTGDNSYSGLSGRQRHEGLIRFLARHGMTPIFFVYNGTAGGIPIYRFGDQCIYDYNQIKARGLPTAFNRNFDAAFGIDVGRSLRLAKIQGGFGNVYAYVLGELEPVLREIGSDFIQIGPKCKPSGHVQSAAQKLQQVCMRANQMLNDQANPLRTDRTLATHYSGGAGYGPCGHRFPGAQHSSPHLGDSTIKNRLPFTEFMSCINFDFIAAGRHPYVSLVRFGAGLFSFVSDLGLREVFDPYRRQGEPNEMLNLYNQHFTRAWGNYLRLTFVPHIDISIAGGLRCSPTENMEDQILKALQSVLRNPRIHLAKNLHELGGNGTNP
ncbi:MAG: hypothetical protein N2654_07490, partial [Deltaproteobacteria bacterium]|nr:hypothetical protein [Deltaproteobacteria bacterium]